jgi:hypothetical protein
VTKIVKLYDNLCEAAYGIMLWDLFWKELHLEPRGRSFDKLIELGFETSRKLSELSSVIDKYCTELKCKKLAKRGSKSIKVS